MSSSILTHLGEMEIATFLERYWQKAPLFVAGALPKIESVDPDILAGFALEPEIESRLVIERPVAGAPLASAWEVLHGPFEESVFESLDEHHWSLLIQAVDHLVPHLHHLLERFKFIPSWRLDDIMVSYATDQGSVGPHYDHYDVFLIQAQGVREWRIGGPCASTTPMRDDVSMKLLREFDTEQTFTARPGDLLYIPAHIAHWGIAQGESVTYSIGFRAPSHAEMLDEFATHLGESLTEHHRYQDPDLKVRTNPGEITPADSDRAHRIILEAMASRPDFATWFGRYMTEPRRSSLTFSPPRIGYLLPDVRCAFIATDQSRAQLFVNGETFNTSLSFAQQLCRERTVDHEHPTGEEQALIKSLKDEGWLV